MRKRPEHPIADDDRPLYQQIKEQIRLAIISGKYPRGTRLPSVRELSLQQSCSAITTKRVYQDLANEGYIRTEQGTGTFIVADEELIGRDAKRFVTSSILRAVECGLKHNYTGEQLQAMFQEAILLSKGKKRMTLTQSQQQQVQEIENEIFDCQHDPGIEKKLKDIIDRIEDVNVLKAVLVNVSKSYLEELVM